jgi:arginine exporter protein ArgO
LASCFGTGLGGLLHVLAAALGLSLIIAQSAVAFNLLKYIGAAYLVYLGIRMLNNLRFFCGRYGTTFVPFSAKRRDWGVRVK